MKHTEGPWNIQCQGPDEPCFIIGPEPVNLFLAALKPGRLGHGFGLQDKLTQEEQIANARLMAAAPDLLKACQTAFDNLKPRYSSDHIVIKRLAGAISKALGTN